MKQDLIGTLTLLRQALAHEYRILPMDVPNSPVFLAVALPVSPEVTGVKPRLPSGRGLSLLQAMVSAGAEALELRASLAWNNAARIATLHHVAGHGLINARNLQTGAMVAVPAQMVFLDHAAATGEALETDARSTGCAIAPNKQAATIRALLECIERDALVFWWHGGVAAQSLPLEIVDRLAPRLVWWLQTRPRRTRLLALTSDTGVPVAVAASADPDGRSVAYGAAADFNASAACLAAITEMVQTETAFAIALASGSIEARAWHNYASIQSLAQFNPAADGAPIHRHTNDMASLLNRLADLGLAALAVDLTLQSDPLPTFRVLVPGLCDMGARIDEPRFRQLVGMTNPDHFPARHEPEPF